MVFAPPSFPSRLHFDLICYWPAFCVFPLLCLPLPLSLFFVLTFDWTITGDHLILSTVYRYCSFPSPTFTYLSISPPPLPKSSTVQHTLIRRRPRLRRIRMFTYKVSLSIIFLLPLNISLSPVLSQTIICFGQINHTLVCCPPLFFFLSFVLVFLPVCLCLCLCLYPLPLSVTVSSCD